MEHQQQNAAENYNCQFQFHRIVKGTRTGFFPELRLFAKVICAVAAVFMAFVTTALEVGIESMVKNPGFEQDMANWKKFPGSWSWGKNCFVGEVINVEGKGKVFCFDGKGRKLKGRAYQNINMRKYPSRITLSADISCKDLPSGWIAGVWVICMDKKYKELAKKLIDLDRSQGEIDGKWHNKNAEMDVPEATALMRIVISIEASQTAKTQKNTAYALFDNIIINSAEAKAAGKDTAADEKTKLLKPLLYVSFDKGLNADIAKNPYPVLKIMLPSLQNEGKKGKAVHMTGNSLLGYTINHLNAEEGTVAFWAQNLADVSNRKNYPFLFRLDVKDSGSIQLNLTKGRPFLWMGMYSDGKKFAPQSRKIDWPVNEWKHFALTWKKGGDMLLYVDGKVFLKYNKTKTPGIKPAPATVWIGGNSRPGNTLQGNIDDFYLFEKVLDPVDIINLAGLTPEFSENKSAARLTKVDPLLIIPNLVTNGDFSFSNGWPWSFVSGQIEQGRFQVRRQGKESSSFSQPFQIPTNRKLRVSFRARVKGKGKYEVKAGIFYSVYQGGKTVNGHWNLAGRNLTDEFKTFSAVCPVKDGNLRRASIKFFITPKSPDADATIEVDDVMVEPILSREDLEKMPEAVLTRSESAKTAGVFTTGEAIKLKIHLANLRQKSQKIHLQASVMDYYGNNVETLNREVALSPYAQVTEDVTFKAPGKRGFYSVIYTLKNEQDQRIDNMVRGFCVLPPDKPGQNDVFFGLSAYRTAPWMAKVYSQAGIGAVLQSIGWAVERTPGKFQFSGPDRAIKIYKDAKLKIYGFFNSETLTISWMLPSWERKSFAKLVKEGTAAKNDAHFNKLRGYIEACVKRYKDDIDLWHVKNEVDIHMKSIDDMYAQYYVRFVKTVSEAARKYDPGCTITALGITSRDWGNNYMCLIPLWQALHNYVDEAWPHPYARPRYIGPGKSWQLVDNYMRKRLLEISALGAKYGKPKIGTSEVGYQLDPSLPVNDKYNKIFAELVSRIAIIYRSIPQATFLGYFTAMQANDDYGLWEKEIKGFAWNIDPQTLYPRPAAAAYSAAAHLLAHISDQKYIDREKNMYVCSFKKGSGAVVALWTTLDQGLKVSGQIPAAAQMLDIMAAPVKQLEPGKLKLQLTPSPVYLVFDRVDYANLLNQLNKITSEQDKVIAYSSLADNNKVELLLGNQVSQKLAVSVTSSSGQKFNVNIEPQKQKTLYFNAADQLKFEIEADNQKTTYTYTDHSLKIPKAKTALSVKDDFEKFKTSEPIFVFDKSTMNPSDADAWGFWTGMQDFSGKLYMQWDEKNLYVAAEVVDDIHISQERGRVDRNAWKFDSMVIAIDANNDATPFEFSGKTGYGNYDYETTYGLNKKVGPIAYCYRAQQGTPMFGYKKLPPFDVQRKGTIFYYKVAIPWSYIPPLKGEAGRVFKANVLISDSDKYGRFDLTMSISRGIHTGKCPYLFRSFILSK